MCHILVVVRLAVGDSGDRAFVFAPAGDLDEAVHGVISTGELSNNKSVPWSQHEQRGRPLTHWQKSLAQVGRMLANCTKWA